MYKQVLILLISLFLGLQVKAQVENSVLNAFQHYSVRASDDYSKLLFLVRSPVEKEVTGNAFFNNWEEAILVVKEQELYSVKARYQIYNDEFQIELNGKTKIVYPNLVKGVIFKDRIFVTGKFQQPDGLQYGFYEQLSGGNVELLKRYIIEHKVGKDGIVRLKTAESSLCYRKKGGLVEAIPSGHNHFFSIFNEYQDQIKIYYQESKLSLSKTSDLKQIFDFYNQL